MEEQRLLLELHPALDQALRQPPVLVEHWEAGPFYFHIVDHVVSYDHLYFCAVCCDFSIFISNFIYLSLLLFFKFISLVNSLSTLFTFSNK